MRMLRHRSQKNLQLSSLSYSRSWKSRKNRYQNFMNITDVIVKQLNTSSLSWRPLRLTSPLSPSLLTKAAASSCPVCSEKTNSQSKTKTELIRSTVTKHSWTNRTLSRGPPPINQLWPCLVSKSLPLWHLIHPHPINRVLWSSLKRADTRQTS